MKVPRTASTGWASNPITAQEAISVTTYADGTRTCVHNRLDLMNRRIIPTEIHPPEAGSDSPFPMAHSLCYAADEWLARAYRDIPLW
jgi:hypothetical protein